MKKDWPPVFHTDPQSTLRWRQGLRECLFLTGRVSSALLASCSWCVVAESNPVLSPAAEMKLCETSVSIKCPDRNSSNAACDRNGTGKIHSQVGIHVQDCWIHLGPVVTL